MATLDSVRGGSHAEWGVPVPMRPARGWRIAKKLAKGTALLLVVSALSYLVGMNVFLRTHLFRDAAGADPETLLIDYASAYSVWPGRIHVEGLSIRGRDSNVEWILLIDRCDFRVSFADLVHAKFHAHRVRGDGLSLRIRLRTDTMTPERMAALPPVPGFPDPPLRDVGPVAPPLTDANYDLWSVELDDVVAEHVREIWIDTMRVSGDLEIRGRWLFRPVRWLEVGPAILDARELQVGYGMVEPWSSGVTGRLDVTIHPLDLQGIEGVEILEHTSIRGDVGGTAHVANVLNRTFQARATKMTVGDAPLEVHADLDHGVLRPGTYVHSSPFDAAATAEGLALEASLQIELHVDDDDVGYAGLHVAAARVSAGGLPRARALSIATTLTSRELDLSRPFSDATYAVDVDGADIESLAYWRSRVAPTSDVEIPSGTVRVGGHLEGVVADATGKGHVTLDAHGLVVARGDTRAQGEFHGVVDVRRVDVEKHQVAGDARLDAEHLVVRTPGMNLEADVMAHAVVREGQWRPLHFDFGGSEVSVRRGRATVRGVSLVMPALEARTADLVVGTSGVVGRVSMHTPYVGLPSAPALASLVTLPPDVAIDGGQIGASVQLDVDLAPLAFTGRALIEARRLRVRVGAGKLDGELTAALQATQRGRVTELSGSRFEFKSAGAPGTLDWWGKAHLDEATVRIHPDLRFRTRFRAQARDASPLTAYVASNTAIPRWLIDTVSTKQLDVTGEVLVSPTVFALRSVQARARGADVGFEMSTIGADKEWALLLDLGAVVAGIGDDDGTTQVLLFGARPWFQQRTESLQALEQRGE
jgi:hypothetical protein